MTLTNLLSKATPDTQHYFAKNAETAHFGDYPTVGDIYATAGPPAAVQWLMAQITNLSMFSGSRNLDIGQLRETATLLATEYPYLRVTEFLLFFHRFKAGRYGKFYGNVDPLTITTAMREFIRERGEAWFRREQEERRHREKTERENDPPITWEEYCRRHGKSASNPLKHLLQ